VPRARAGAMGYSQRLTQRAVAVPYDRAANGPESAAVCRWHRVVWWWLRFGPGQGGLSGRWWG
jgi:hypothetical protein